MTLSTFTGQESIINNAEKAVGEFNNKVINEQEMLNDIREYIKNDGNVEEVNGITISVVADTTGVAKNVTVTIAAISDDGIRSLTSNAGINKTYTEGTKEILETCEITENGIYTFTVENEKGKKASKGILIGNILEGTIGITADKTMPTKDNVKVTITWPEGSENGIKEIKVGNNSWKAATGNISEVEITTNCTVEARVRNGNEDVMTSSITISNIDKANPIVTATSGAETITEGTSVDISNYFTYLSNGIAEITSVTYTDTSNENAVVTNTNTLSIGTHIIKCTVTKETGLSASVTKTIVIEKSGMSSTEIESNPGEHWGGYVTNYTTPSGDPNVKWRIFYADESNVYLIASDYININYAPTSNNNELDDNGGGYKLSFDILAIRNSYAGAANITDPRITKWINYVKDNSRASGDGMRAVAFMLDESRWSAKYANPDYAEYAIGGPTLELWCESYKKAHPDQYIEYSYNGTGYNLKWSTNSNSPTYNLSGAEDNNNLYYIKTTTSKAASMWIASPSSYNSRYLMHVYSNGNVGERVSDNRTTGFRPIICLKSEILLKKQGDGTYLIDGN